MKESRDPTLEEYVGRFLLDINGVLELLDRPEITAEELKEKGFVVVKCDCGSWCLKKGD